MKNNIIDKFSLSRSGMKKYAEKLITQGVIIVDPSRIDIRGKLICGKNVTIDINVIFEGDVTLEDGVRIGANCIINNSFIGNNSNIKPFSMVEDSIIGENVFIGPYGRIRPGTKIGDKSQIGNFVEIKNSVIKSNSRINHLSFIGDSDLGRRVTIGAGTITCNHNGIKINRTRVGENAYIGSGCNLIAPIEIGSNATIAAGSTLDKDAPCDHLTIARARQKSILPSNKSVKK